MAVGIKIMNYSFIKELGAGQFGEVYLAQNENNDQFAIKIIKKSKVASDQASKKLFTQEVKVMKLLSNSKYIVKFKEVLSSSNNYYLVLEYCNQGDLKQYIKTNRLTEEKARIHLLQIVEGFKEMYRNNVMHRDVKLDNIMLSNDCCKIGDFGFSRVFDPNKMHTTYVGTPITMSPEMLQGQRYDSRSDIWSLGNSCYDIHQLYLLCCLGVIYYQLLHNQYPYHATSVDELLMKQKQQPIEYKPGISTDSKDLINKCLTYDYKKRINWDSLFRHKMFHTNLYIELSVNPNIVGRSHGHEEDAIMMIQGNQQINENEGNQQQNDEQSQKIENKADSNAVQQSHSDDHPDDVNPREVENEDTKLSEQEKQRLLQIDLHFTQNNQIISQQWSSILYLSKLEVRFNKLIVDQLNNPQNIHCIDVDLYISSQHLCHLQILKKLKNIKVGLSDDNVLNLNEFEDYIKTDHVKEWISTANAQTQTYKQRQEELNNTLLKVEEKKKSLNNQQHLMSQDESQQSEVQILSYKNMQCFENLKNTMNRMDVRLISDFTKKLLMLKFNKHNQLNIKQLLLWWNIQDILLIETFIFNQENKLFKYLEYWEHKKQLKVEEVFEAIFLNQQLIDQA